MIHYIIQVLAFQLVFLMIYDLFLKRETFFTANRVYLLVTPLVAFLLPWVEIDLFREAIPTQYHVQLPEIIIGGNGAPTEVQHSSSSIPEILGGLWLVGVFISTLLFAIKLYKIKSLKRKGTVTKFSKFNVIELPASDKAFTFMKDVFIGENLSEEQKTHIVMHEQVHVREFHTLDLLFFEGLRIVFWFNPLVYIFQKRVAMLQEFIADAHVANQEGKKEYYNNLLSQVFSTNKISFINTFFNNSLIKNRIVMLQKSRSRKILQLKYLFLIPVIGGMLLYTSCTQDASAQATADSTAEQSEILQKIAELKESIAAKGNMTKEEEDALKVLYVLTNSEGVHVDAFEAVKDKAGIPFGVIHKPPVFPGCEGIDDAAAAKKCFTEKITNYVVSNFNVDIAKEAGLEGRMRIVTKFKVNTKGEVADVVVKAPHPSLEKETLKVIKGIPKLKPGQHQGKTVTVEYALPIVFAVN